MYECAIYSTRFSLLIFYEQIEIGKKEEEKKIILFYAGNQFEIQKEKKMNFTRLCLVTEIVIVILWLLWLLSSLHDFFRLLNCFLN